MSGGFWLDLKPANDSLERRIYLDRGYEPATLRLFDRVLRPGDLMIDVGANIGVMTLHAAMRVGRTGMVLAMEPHPLHFHRLIQNVELNRLTQVTALNVALGETPERRMIFDLPQENGGSASLLAEGGSRIAAGAVDVRRLDDIVARIDRRPRLIKIDVEGFEPQVLRGAPETLARGAVICMEIEPRGAAPLEAHRLLMATGHYEPFRFRRSKFAASPLVRFEDIGELPRHAPDNLVYVPIGARETLPADLFAL
jgi:FkbM family methyltransferase